jgi:glycine oxidase
MKALQIACRSAGVELKSNAEAAAIVHDGQIAAGVRLSDGTVVRAGCVAITAGAWAARFLEFAGEPAPIYPVRGQIAAYQTTGHLVEHIVEVGKRYLVPRDDGLVLVGSTEEEVGFDRSTTEDGLAGLHQFAVDLFPELDACPLAASWAGLRPGNRLGFPWIGRVSPFQNVWAGCGHFRQGIQLSTGTSRLLADWITGQESFVAEDAFQPARRSLAFQSSFHS